MTDKRSSRASPSACWSKAACCTGRAPDRCPAPLDRLGRADGSIVCDGHAGSIHKVGAALQGAPSCNGWTFWHVEEGGSLMLIDALRQKHLSALG